MSCGVGCRRISDPTWLWLWHRLVATAPIRPLAWEPPYAADMALERAKKRERERERGAITNSTFLLNLFFSLKNIDKFPL